MVSFSLLVAATASFAAAQTANRTYTLLETTRDKITFVPYTPEQRVTIAKGLQSMFSIYVHREKKIQSYDQEYRKFSGQTIDPVPRVAAMVEKAANMTDKEFHYAFTDLFASLRDLHTNYLMPAPHACYGFVQAVDFTVAAVKPHWYTSTKQELVVQQFASQPELNQLSYPDIAKMNVGDIVLKINGKTFEEFVESVKWFTGGNNESGGIRNALTHLAARSGVLMKVPEENKVTYEMQSYNDASKKYTVTLPWIASRKDDCYRKYLKFEADMANSTSPDPATRFRNRFTLPPRTPKIDKPSPVEIKRRLKKNLNSMKSIQMDFYKQFFPFNPSGDKVTFIATSDPILKWAIYAPKNMGILQISSFEYVFTFLLIHHDFNLVCIPIQFRPVNNDDKALVNLVRSLLVKELKDTDSLLLDMRDNGGGDIAMADLLPQLFATKPVFPTYARAIVSPANDYIFANSTDAADSWYRATQNAPNGSIYSPLIQFTTVKEANQVGAAYFKPVGYFQNGNCFSACDLMAANVQDNEVMTVFGEDIRSGAGGLLL